MVSHFIEKVILGKVRCAARKTWAGKTRPAVFTMFRDRALRTDLLPT